MTVTPSDLDYLAALYAAAAATENAENALQRFTNITDADESACDAWVGRISRGDLQRSTLFRAWFSRRNFGRLASAADLSVVSLNAWVPIGAGFAHLRAPVTSPTALTVAYAISEATNGGYDDAIEALDEAHPTDLTTWARAIIYATGTRWDKAIETLNEHHWQEPIFAQCAELIHGAAAAHLGIYVEAERRLGAALTAEQSKIPCAEHGAWYLAMVYRATGREEEAVAKLQWLHAQYPSPRVSAALEDPSIRLAITTRERLADRDDPWADEAAGGGSDAPKIRKELLDEASAKLNKQIGLEGVKEQIADYRASVQMAAIRAAKGLKTNQGSHHMIFTGPPGTGKTTIADIVALNLAGLGVITEPRVIHANGRADLCAEYEGQSAPKTSRLIDRALGGVLFIDEFYTLAQERDGRNDPFGQEALDTLLARIENDRDKLVVIIAGYPADIDRTLDKNDGLRSRFNTRIEFITYSPQEIVAIANVMAADNDSLIDAEASALFLAAAEQLLNTVFKDQKGRDKNGLDHAGNGRYARNVVEAAERARNRRQVEMPNHDELTAEELQIITAADMQAGIQKVHARL